VATTSTLSRRTSEFAGVALFAISLIWLIALVTHEPADPVWFFTAGDSHPAANFVGLVGAFISEVSLQVLGYASFLVPRRRGGWPGWSLFWCRTMDSAYTKSFGAGMFLGLPERAVRAHRRQCEVNGRDVQGRRLHRRVDRRRMHSVLEPAGRHHRRAHAAGALGDHGHSVFLRADIRCPVRGLHGDGLRLITQFQSWREGTPALKPSGREVIAKHTREEWWNGCGRGGGVRGRRRVHARARKGTRREEPRAAARRRDRGRRRDASPAASMPLRRPSTTPPPHRAERAEGQGRGPARALPLEPADSASREPVERRMGGYTLPPLTLLGCAEGRAEDRRA
jgi:S-DNA-T family DNA segregation ATPase FtsK/SpoIIIE